jgi:hypothetical protein
MASFAFGAPMPTPAPAPAQRDAAAWESAFLSLWQANTPRALPTGAATANTAADYPLRPLRTYAVDALTLCLLGDADGMLREVYITQPLADIAQSEAPLLEAFDAFSTTAAMAMAAAAEQPGALAIEANENLLGDAMERVIYDDNTPFSLFYNWNGLDLEVGLDGESLVLYMDLFL